MNINKLKEEFAGKTNHQAYDLAFTKRMLRPHPSETGAFLGNTQRQEFVPLLKSLLQQLPRNPQICDVGAGGGEIIDVALCGLAEATINLIEPNPVLLEKYKSRLQLYPRLHQGVSYCGLLQDYYLDSGVQTQKSAAPQDLILAIHMLYHLTEPRGERFEPEADLTEAIQTMFSFLAPGGSLFVVFANQLVSTTGQAGRYYFNAIGESKVSDRLLEIAKVRLRLLADGEIIPKLEESFGRGSVSLETKTTPSCIYGDSEEDIVAMCITAEIGQINDEPFDVCKLDICARFVETHAREIGLAVENRNVAQKGMVRSDQPQIVSIISRLNG